MVQAVTVLKIVYHLLRLFGATKTCVKLHYTYRNDQMCLLAFEFQLSLQQIHDVTWQTVLETSNHSEFGIKRGSSCCNESTWACDSRAVHMWLRLKASIESRPTRTSAWCWLDVMQVEIKLLRGTAEVNCVPKYYLQPGAAASYRNLLWRSLIPAHS